MGNIANFPGGIAHRDFLRPKGSFHPTERFSRAGRLPPWRVAGSGSAIMSEAGERSRIEKALEHPWALIPRDLLPAFHAFHHAHSRRFLLIVNLWAQLAFVSYGVADYLVLQDIGWNSLLLRMGFSALTLPFVFLIFQRSRNMRLMDLLLPVLILTASVIWFEILAHSNSPLITNYLYAGVIFIVLANLGVQVYFLPAMGISLAIGGYTIWNAYRLNHPDAVQASVFVLVYLPILLFSLFNSWSTTHEKRRSFLRAQLDMLTRRELAQANQKLAVLAHTDSLTGVSNRRHFEEQGRLEVARARRHGHPLCLLSLDIDHFKKINDTCGHVTGDRVLQALCRRIESKLRENDLLARYGGEEFQILLPDTDLPAAQQVAERLRRALAESEVATDDGKMLRFTVSIGIAPLESGCNELEQVIRSADRELYRAKASGRNRVSPGLAAPALQLVAAS